MPLVAIVIIPIGPDKTEQIVGPASVCNKNLAAVNDKRIEFWKICSKRIPFFKCIEKYFSYPFNGFPIPINRQSFILNCIETPDIIKPHYVVSMIMCIEHSIDPVYIIIKHLCSEVRACIDQNILIFKFNKNGRTESFVFWII